MKTANQTVTQIAIAIALTTAAALSLTGCLMTRDEVRESVKPDAPTPEQQRSANNEVRYQELESQGRTLVGRVETLENSVNMLSADKSGKLMEHQNAIKSLEEKTKILEEALSKLETQYLQLAQKVETLQTAAEASAHEKKETKAAKGDAAKNSFSIADDDFTKKNWKASIVSFQKYREQNPGGKHYAEATYKIGAAFTELGMKSESHTFYSEVVEKFPKTDWAKKAALKLKTK